MKMQSGVQTQYASKESPGYIASMDTMLFLEGIMHSHSYMRYILLHTGRTDLNEADKRHNSYSYSNKQQTKSQVYEHEQ
jgi:hypothetical protein